MLAASGVAYADVEPAPPESEPAPAPASADGSDQLTLPKGRAVINVFLEMNLASVDDGMGGSESEIAKPISIAPDLWYGVDDKLTIGLVHSDIGDSTFIGAVGEGICLSGKDNGCGHVYNNVAFHVRYGLAKGANALALDGGVSLISLSDPFQAALNVGLVGRYHAGKLAFEYSPRIFAHLNNRGDVDDGTTQIEVADDFFNVSGTLIYSVSEKATFMAQLGVSLPFEHTGDFGLLLPLSVGTNIKINPKFDLLVAFSLPFFLSKNTVDDDGNLKYGVDTDERSLTVGGSYAF
jgi:hypothetical protein